MVKSIAQSIINSQVKKMGGSFFDSDDDSPLEGIVMDTKADSKPSIWQPKGKTNQWASCEHFRFPLPVGKGKSIYLSSSRGHEANLRKEGHREVDYGVYLDGSWRSKLEVKPTTSYSSGPLVNGVNSIPAGFIENWETKYNPPEPLNGVYLPWSDRGAPPMHKITPLLDWLCAELDSDRTFEIACMGGHGRTGTLAAMLLLRRADGKIKPGEAISLIREVYCKEAIESWEQVQRIFESVGEVAPDSYKPKTNTITSSTGGSKQNKGVTNSGLTSEEIVAIRLFHYNAPEKRLAFPFTGVDTRKEVIPTSYAPVPTE